MTFVRPSHYIGLRMDVIMVCDVKFPIDLASRLKSAAQDENLSIEEWIVIAAAEKLARMEHQTWLGKQLLQSKRSTEERPASLKDEKH